jgi:hypothetical protein
MIAPAHVPVPAPLPPSAHIRLIVQHAYGSPLFALAGGRIVVRGVVTPYVAGQSVKVSFYREGRKVQVRKLSVLAIGNGSGQFHINFSSAAGCLQRPLGRRAVRTYEPLGRCAGPIGAPAAIRAKRAPLRGAAERCAR